MLVVSANKIFLLGQPENIKKNREKRKLQLNEMEMEREMRASCVCAW